MNDNTYEDRLRLRVTANRMQLSPEVYARLGSPNFVFLAVSVLGDLVISEFPSSASDIAYTVYVKNWIHWSPAETYEVEPGVYYGKFNENGSGDSEDFYVPLEIVRDSFWPDNLLNVPEGVGFYERD